MSIAGSDESHTDGCFPHRDCRSIAPLECIISDMCDAGRESKKETQKEETEIQSRLWFTWPCDCEQAASFPTAFVSLLHCCHLLLFVAYSTQILDTEGDQQCRMEMG